MTSKDKPGGPLQVPDIPDRLRPKVPDAAKKQIINQSQRLSEAVSEAIRRINKNTATVPKMLEGYKVLTEKIMNSASTLEARAILNNIAEDFSELQALLDEEDALRPHLYKELEAVGLTIDDLYRMNVSDLLAARNNPEHDIYKAFEKAAKKRADNPPRRTVQHTDKIVIPIDKVNQSAFNLPENKDATSGLNFRVSPEGKKLVTVLYQLNFDELENDIAVIRRLTPLDRRVYNAVAALYSAGNDIITIRQIHGLLSGSSDPSTTQIKRYDASLMKMRFTKLQLDNKSEADEYKRPHYQYRGYLLPAEDLSAIINGQITNSAIHLLKEPPLVEYARKQKQVTTVNPILLQSPINKTDANILLADYLITRISQKKRSGKVKTFRILLKTLYERTGIKKPKQRQRAPKKIKTELQHYKTHGFIKGYELQKDAIKILL